jgi:large subunit ribosomal protein L10
MPTERKEATITQLEERFKRAKALVFTGFHGLTASEMVALRATLTKRNLEYRVIKNSLALLAAQRAGLDIEGLLQQETGICFGYDDPVLAFKLTSELAKQFANYKIRGGVAEGQRVTEQGVAELAKLPSREVLLARLAGALQGPMRQVTVVLNALLREFVVVLAEIERVKGKASQPEPGPAAPPEATPSSSETEKGAQA